jgi:hypothetical protein
MTEKPKPKSFKMFDLADAKTTKGTSILLYGPSASRKTRTIGSLGNNAVVLHISLDNGASSALAGAKSLGRDGTIHKVVCPSNLEELNDVIIGLHTGKAYKDNIDVVVVDNLTTLVEWIRDFLYSTKRFKVDMNTIEDALTGDDSNKQSSKMLPFYSQLQLLTKQLNNQLLELTDSYNVILLAHEVEGTDASGATSIMPECAGPKSLLPLISVFNEVYRTEFKDGDLDTPEHCATFFKVSSYNDPMSGTRYFAKTRGISTTKYLQDNLIPANLDYILTKEVGYIYKKDRAKE